MPGRHESEESKSKEDLEELARQLEAKIKNLEEGRKKIVEDDRMSSNQGKVYSADDAAHDANNTIETEELKQKINDKTKGNG